MLAKDQRGDNLVVTCFLPDDITSNRNNREHAFKSHSLIKTR